MADRSATDRASSAARRLASSTVRTRLAGIARQLGAAGRRAHRDGGLESLSRPTAVVASQVRGADVVLEQRAQPGFVADAREQSAPEFGVALELGGGGVLAGAAGGEHVAGFAPALPGPPVSLVVEKDDAVIRRMTLLSRK